MNDYRKTIDINASSNRIYDALTKGVTHWWTTGSEDASEVGKVFVTHFEETYNHIRITRLIPDRCVEWEILKHHHANDELSRKDEWVGTHIHWNLTPIDETKTRLDFVHEGLQESMECWEICEAGWNFFLDDSLKPYVETGTGQPFQHCET